MRLEGNWVWKWGDTRGSQIHLVMGQALGVIALDLGFGAEICHDLTHVSCVTQDSQSSQLCYWLWLLMRNWD